MIFSILEVRANQEIYFDNIVNKSLVVDLIIIDYLDGLHILGVPILLHKFLPRMYFFLSFFQVVMAFTYQYLHHNKEFLMFYLDLVNVKKLLDFLKITTIKSLMNGQL